MNATILIVEDEPAIQELLAFNVMRAGLQAVCVGDADSAWEQIQNRAPDLILLDWMLPGTSGVALAKQLRADARTRDIPIIMLTARSEERDKVLGLESGADDYITKPFDPLELEARISLSLKHPATNDSKHPVTKLPTKKISRSSCIILCLRTRIFMYTALT